MAEPEVIEYYRIPSYGQMRLYYAHKEQKEKIRKMFKDLRFETISPQVVEYLESKGFIFKEIIPPNKL